MSLTIDQIINDLKLENYSITNILDSPVLELDKFDIIKTVAYLYQKELTHLSTIIGYQRSDEIILDYPLSTLDPNNSGLDSLIIRTILSMDKELKIESIEEILPGSVVYEQEISEFLGIHFLSNKDRTRLLLPDEFPNDIYPLRKDVNPIELKHELDDIGVGRQPLKPLIEKENYSISVGPQHPTHKEPIRFQFYIEGEKINDVALRIGFNHRGIEKALEYSDWIKNLYLIERICGICSTAHQLSYVLTAEKIGKMTSDIPDRATWLRTLIAELERIHSHILWYGILAHDGGYDLMFHVTWRDREIVMDILEMISGNRVNYSIETIGGVRKDIDDSAKESIMSKLKELKSKVLEHHEILEKEQSFIKRLSTVGILNYDMAVKMNTVGPTARASGINFDLRKNLPYIAYKEIPFSVQIRREGDVYATLKIRLDETLESIDMCIYILENLPNGEIAIPFRGRLPEGEAFSRVEAPRGEDFHFIRSVGGKQPDRYKVRAPTLANITSLLQRFKGMNVADIPMIIRLIDPCIGCMERVTFINTKSGKVKELEGLELISKINKNYRLKNSTKIFGGV